MNRPRVLFIGSFQPGKNGATGGQYKACTTLLAHPKAQEIDWILLDTTAPTNLKRAFWRRLLAAAFRLLKFVWILISQRVDVALIFCSAGYSFKEKGLMAKVAKVWGKKVVLAPRSGLIQKEIEESEDFRGTVVKTLNRIDVLLCQSEFWRSYYQNISENKELTYAVISNWIDLSEYRELPTKVTSEAKPLQILFIGWITRNKGIYDLMAAAERLKEKNVEWLLAGHGDAFDDIAALIEKKRLKDKVKLLGWVNKAQKKQLLASADVFVLPSYREGYPNALLEAMAYGLPVISTEVGAIPDLIESGKNGLLIEPGDDSGLAHHINSLEQNRELLQKMGPAGRQSVFAKNDVEIAAKRMVELLRDLSENGKEG